MESYTENELTCSGSKFGSKESHPGAPRSRRGLDGVADHRRCDEFNLLRGENSPGRWDSCVLGHLSGRGILWLFA